MLASISSRVAPTGNGLRKAFSSFCAIARTRAGSLSSGNNKANSSPPRRHSMLASSPSSAFSRGPICCSNRSPMWWPSVSLMSLNRSRSNSSSAAPGNESLREAMTCSNSRCRNIRFGKPVRLSWCAR